VKLHYFVTILTLMTLHWSVHTYYTLGEVNNFYATLLNINANATSQI